MSSLRRSAAVVVVGSALALGTVLTPGAAARPSAVPGVAPAKSATAAKATLPPSGAARYGMPRLKCINYGNYVTVRGTPWAMMKAVPRKTRGTTSYYQKITVKLQALAGTGSGALWKTTAKKKYESGKIPVKHANRYLPVTTYATVYDNFKHALGVYRVQMDVKIRNHKRFLPDTTAWKYTATSASKTCASVR
ncbi:MAG TPA: hypothetical protein VFN19_01840 [Candidatus Nanopelagicales bacterium]|jgi:hypothetical protein|nr:hypothetical protein [Candidatus Nanopelagicales bacterium]